jgi:hypothetical protein
MATASAPSSEGATRTRSSALLPVIEKPDSHWMCVHGGRPGRRARPNWRANSTGESQVPRKSASRPTTTRARSNA